MNRFLVSGLGLAALLAPLGCGKGYETVPVSGRITLNGRPQAGMIVTFTPTVGAAGKQLPAAQGVTDGQGRFSLKVFEGKEAWGGALVGENRVMITLNERDLGRAPSRGARAPRQLIPAKYHSDPNFKTTVPQGGTGDANWDVKTR